MDVELLKKQTETLGEITEGKEVPDEDIADLEGLWEMLEYILDQIKEV